MAISRITQASISLGLFLTVLTDLPLSQGIYHLVKKGETLYRIAKTYSVDMDKIMEANLIEDPTKIRAGQKLLIPDAKPPDDAASPEVGSNEMIVHHLVKKGETLYRIAKTYSVDMDKIMEANLIEDPTKIRAGQSLSVPAVDSIDKSTSKPDKESFIWPLTGRVISKFEVRNGVPYDGIDIAVSKEEAVKAAMSGVVLYSDNKQNGYGNMIIISHGGSVFTVYAHNSANLAREGQRVRRGEAIARIGSEDRAAGGVLHFEIRINGKAVDPLDFLPGIVRMEAMNR
jgi:murein DD-endopeptidase MepM/ murein hydrolase activator NlpD